MAQHRRADELIEALDEAMNDSVRVESKLDGVLEATDSPVAKVHLQQAQRTLAQLHHEITMARRAIMQQLNEDSAG